MSDNDKPLFGLITAEQVPDILGSIDKWIRHPQGAGLQIPIDSNEGYYHIKLSIISPKKQRIGK